MRVLAQGGPADEGQVVVVLLLFGALVALLVIAAWRPR